MKPFNLEEYLKNPLRKVVTRDGRAVKIYCTDYIDEDNGSVIAKIEGDTYSNSFREDGRFVIYEETDNDLFFASEKHEGWVNVYKEDKSYNVGNLFSSKEDALAVTKGYNVYVATIKIEWEE